MVKIASVKSIDLFNADRQIGAVGIAEMAGGALLRGNHDRVVAVRMHRQNIRWAEFNADLAAFAPGRKDAHFAARPSTGTGWGNWLYR
jgi:hypothetical protein